MTAGTPGQHDALETMRAVVVRAPMRFGVEDVPAPRAPAGGLLLRVLACALCGSDLRTLRGGHRKVTFPWTLGHEICGTVAATGDGYAGEWRVGETLAVGPVVYCGACDFCREGRFELCEGYREIAQAWPGGLAETIAIPAEAVQRGVIGRVPDGLDPALAAVTEPVSSCLNAQEKGAVGLGDVVVVIGTGPIGCIHTCLAHLRGARQVLVADIAQERLAQVEPFGPDAVVDASRVDLVQEVRRLTGERGADVVITANPSPDAQVQAVEMARKGGRILLFGGLPPDRAHPGVDMNLVHYGGLHLIGTTIFAPRHHRQAVELAASGRIPLERLVTRFPLEDFELGAAQALAGTVIKAVFLP
jgi:L-iditol 2-dehydrogenase